MKIVAITSCATGIAHSYMAAEALKKAAKKQGDEIKVEIQGAMGIENELKRDEISQADLIIFAVDVGVRNISRFDLFKAKIFETGPHEAIRESDAVLEKAKQNISH